MRTPGVEPGPLAGQDPKSCASASSATFASLAKITEISETHHLIIFLQGVGCPSASEQGATFFKVDLLSG